MRQILLEILKNYAIRVVIFILKLNAYIQQNIVHYLYTLEFCIALTCIKLNNNFAGYIKVTTIAVHIFNK